MHTYTTHIPTNCWESRARYSGTSSHSPNLHNSSIQILIPQLKLHSLTQHTVPHPRVSYLKLQSILLLRLGVWVQVHGWDVGHIQEMNLECVRAPQFCSYKIAFRGKMDVGNTLYKFVGYANSFDDAIYVHTLILARFIVWSPLLRIGYPEGNMSPNPEADIKK